MSYFADSLAILSPSDTFLASILKTVAMVPAEERNDGFKEASALGLLLLPTAVRYQGMETQRELLSFEDVTFGVLHRQKRIILLQTQPFWRSGTCQGWQHSSGARRTGNSAPAVARVLPVACTSVLHGRFGLAASVLPPRAR